MNVWVSSILTTVLLTFFLVIAYNAQYPHAVKVVPCVISEKFTAIENNETVYKFMCKNSDKTLSEKTVTTSTYFKFSLNQVVEFKVRERIKTSPIYELLIQLGVLSCIILAVIIIYRS